MLKNTAAIASAQKSEASENCEPAENSTSQSLWKMPISPLAMRSSIFFRGRGFAEAGCGGEFKELFTASFRGRRRRNPESRTQAGARIWIPGSPLRGAPE
jgi:hypothetical protein